MQTWWHPHQTYLTPAISRRITLHTTVETRLYIVKFKEEKPPPHMVHKFCGLRVKLYALRTVNAKDDTRSKGVPRHKKEPFDAYLSCLLSGGKTKATFNTFRSTLHEISTHSTTKVALSAFDDKRFVLGDGVTTLPYGHYKTVASAGKRKWDGEEASVTAPKKQAVAIS